MPDATITTRPRSECRKTSQRTANANDTAHSTHKGNISSRRKRLSRLSGIRPRCRPSLCRNTPLRLDLRTEETRMSFCSSARKHLFAPKLGVRRLAAALVTPKTAAKRRLPAGSFTRSGRVVLGGCTLRASTDPYVDTLDHIDFAQAKKLGYDGRKVYLRGGLPIPGQNARHNRNRYRGPSPPEAGRQSTATTWAGCVACRSPAHNSASTTLGIANPPVCWMKR